jgi:hypothetical protein
MNALDPMADCLLADPDDEATLAALADHLTDCDPAARVEFLRRLFRRASGRDHRGRDGERVLSRRTVLGLRDLETASIDLRGTTFARQSHGLAQDLMEVLHEVPAAVVSVVRHTRGEHELALMRRVELETRAHITPIHHRGPFSVTTPIPVILSGPSSLAAPPQPPPPPFSPRRSSP